jgi:hypothetical protein
MSEEFQAWQETFPRYTSIKRGPAVTRDPPHLTSNISNFFLCTFLFRSLYLDSFLLRSFVCRSFISRILFRCLSFDPVQSSFDNLVPHRLSQSLILAKEIKTGAKIPQPRRIGAFISLEIAINVFSEVSPPLRISVSMNVFSLCDLSQLTSAFAQPLSMSSATTSVHRVLTRQYSGIMGSIRLFLPCSMHSGIFSCSWSSLSACYSRSWRESVAMIVGERFCDG